MPNMKGAFRKAGFGGGPPASGPGQGRTAGPASLRSVVPADYPKYFTAEGHLRVELVKDEAEKIARCFRESKLTRNQLRSFYDHAKKQLQRLGYGTAFGEIHAEIARLKAFAADRAARSSNALPAAFKEFIDRNVNAVNDEKSFKNGFMPHFEAVVGYCASLRER